MGKLLLVTVPPVPPSNLVPFLRAGSLVWTLTGALEQDSCSIFLALMSEDRTNILFTLYIKGFLSISIFYLVLHEFVL